MCHLLSLQKEREPHARNHWTKTSYFTFYVMFSRFSTIVIECLFWTDSVASLSFLKPSQWCLFSFFFKLFPEWHGAFTTRKERPLSHPQTASRQRNRFLFLQKQKPVIFLKTNTEPRGRTLGSSGDANLDCCCKICVGRTDRGKLVWGNARPYLCLKT